MADHNDDNDDDANMLPPMPLLSISSPETIQKCAALKLRPSDIFICSYPKSGTTWTQHIILSLLCCEHNAQVYKHVSEYAPFFEIDAHWTKEGELIPSIQENHARLGRRVFNTHLRFDMLPKSGGGCKMIYLVRSPLDACVSFYHHLSHQVEGGYEGTLDDFFHEWMDGSIAFGSWIHHVYSYAVAFSKGNGRTINLGDGRELFLLSYQDMMDSLETVVDDLVDFLDLNVTKQQRLELLPTFTFDNMKANIDRFQPQSVQWKGEFSFLRRGVSGDSLNELTPEQRDEFQQWIHRENVVESFESLLKASNPSVYEFVMSLLLEPAGAKVQTQSEDEETQWTDDRIRWTDLDAGKTKNDSDEEEECALIDPFKDPDPFDTFAFQFPVDDGKSINIELRGYKKDADQVWKSTGLTLWRASEYLCHYMVKHSDVFQNKQILELGAGLGLCGILAQFLGRDSTVCITDGDTDALASLRENLQRNKATKKATAHQLIWGADTSKAFLQQHGCFDVLIASDIIYALVIVEPLWETVKTLMRRNKDSCFIMAYAKRDGVPVTIEMVLPAAERAGFTYELVDEDPQGIWVYVFRWKDTDDNDA